VSTQIIARGEDLTADWFASALTGVGLLDGAGVASVSVEPIAGGAFGRMARATLTYDGVTNAPRSIVVKYPTDDPGSLNLALAMGMYGLEVHFYQDVAPLLTRMSIPECYAAIVDPESGFFTLALEDLGDVAKPLAGVGAGGSSGSETPDVIESCDKALTELVRLQAPLWNSPLLSTFEWLSDRTRAIGMFDAMAQGLDPFLERFSHSLDKEQVRFFEAFLPRAGEWVRGWKPPTVVQHGDFRGDNLLFGSAPGARPLTVVDFQTVRLGPPGVDAAYLVGSSLSTEQRRVSERDLVLAYHERLRADGVESFTWDDCWASYREGALYGAFMFVGLASQVESTEAIDRFIAAQARRYADMAIDLEATSAAGMF
jgi:aminoglycoside/choline kinase family phosphotransferase